MVVVEGVARSLDPKLDMWTTSEPVVREWIMRNAGPAVQLEGAVRGVGEAGQLLARLPSLVQRALRITEQIDNATRGGLSLAPETIAALTGGEQRRRQWGTAALWAIAALLAWEVFVK
jgi:ubiquinone biosynthesis protein